MTQEILDMRKLRSTHKKKDVQAYKCIDRHWKGNKKRQKRTASNQEIETCENKYDLFKMHKKKKEKCGRTRESDTLLD